MVYCAPTPLLNGPDAFGCASRPEHSDRVAGNPGLGSFGQGSDVYLGSVQAVTRSGQVVGVDYSGSRQAFYLFGPARGIWVVGVNEVVPDLDAALARLHGIALPEEDARMKATGAPGSAANKTVIYDAEPLPERVTIVLVDQPLGF
ncbi:MAG TPA: LUD domain-containing protein [Kribbella sp.]|uniref:LUD domain-containing protein n=1 Tax=Kribbella sp. TaxID=1871183 RepID=UPI002D767631|nr:LUD domain-containing protein [Kribbella sp.]HET6292213.1 LUD domain-containing protein [Kribbella sp.]